MGYDGEQTGKYGKYNGFLVSLTRHLIVFAGSLPDLNVFIEFAKVFLFGNVELAKKDLAFSAVIYQDILLKFRTYQLIIGNTLYNR